jgi:hypothetical protein
VAHPLVGNPLVGLAGLFLSPAKSVLLYSPTYAFALLGVRRLMQRDRQRFTVIGGCLMIHIALIASLKFWAGEWAWGPRYLIASLPLACIGLPFAARTGTPRRLLLTACGLGLVVQLLGISVDHQRYYFERSLVPFFWVVESSMYRDSPLFARPAELLAVMREADLPRVRALVPGPRPRSMTSTTYGPDHANILRVPAWMREHLVFVVPRPWPLWSRYLTAEERPGPTERLAAAGCAAALVSAVLLTLIAYQPDRRRSAEGTLEYEQVIES